MKYSEHKKGKGYSWREGFTAALAVLVTGASQSRQHVEAIILEVVSSSTLLSITSDNAFTLLLPEDIAVQFCFSLDIQLTSIT
ncbi:hypothetical protein Tco_0674602 [Tanacetum coccineum]